jgi:hypothetical protein
MIGEEKAELSKLEKALTWGYLGRSRARAELDRGWFTLHCNYTLQTSLYVDLKLLKSPPGNALSVGLDVTSLKA